MALKKQALCLSIVSAAISVISLGQFASAQFSINSGQSCNSIGQIRDYQGQRFICRRVNAKAGSSSGPYLIWFKISSPKTTTKPTTSTSSTLKVSCATGGECRVGDIGPGGGLVFYVSSSPQLWGRYMEAAPNGWTKNSWSDVRHQSGCFGMSIPEASGLSLGSGKRNTEAIVAGCLEPYIAARVAFDLVYMGKSDWFLPSRDELNAMYPHREAIGFRLAENNQVYASSTWPSPFNFSAQMFTTDTATSFVSGRQFETTRTTPYSYFVRPIRYGDFGS